jgi:hypothetical protein
MHDFQIAAPYRVTTASLVFAFVLELAMFICLGIWGWHVGDGGLLSGLLAVLFVAVPGAVWGLCRTPGDLPHGRSRVPVPGPVRLLIEFAVLGLAVYGIWVSGSRAAGETLLTAGVIHYALLWERIRWLLRGSRSGR